MNKYILEIMKYWRIEETKSLHTIYITHEKHAYCATLMIYILKNLCDNVELICSTSQTILIVTHEGRTYKSVAGKNVSRET